MIVIDTVLISLPHHEDLSVFSRLDSCSESVNTTTGEVMGYKGQLKNVYVKLGLRGLMVQGSLPAFYKGSNFHVLTPSETAETIESLSDALDLSLRYARVYRVDFGFNLPVKTKPQNIIRALGPACARRTKLDLGKASVVYKTKSHETAFYDKIDWARSKRVPVPVSTSEHLIRVERRIKKGVRSRFENHLQRKVRPVTAAQLGSADFQDFGLVEWERAVAQVPFERAVNFMFQRTTAQNRDALAAKGIESLGGLETLTDLLRATSTSGDWPGTAKEAQRTRSELRRLVGLPSVTALLDEEEDFREAAAKAVEDWRAMIRAHCD